MGTIVKCGKDRTKVGVLLGLYHERQLSHKWLRDIYRAIRGVYDGGENVTFYAIRNEMAARGTLVAGGVDKLWYVWDVCRCSPSAHMFDGWLGGKCPRKDEGEDDE